MTTKESLGVGNAAKLPDGWKTYDKYQIRHTDGMPLKGKRYFVLRLDSDDPLEAARVAAAMSAYKGETPQGNAAAIHEALETIRKRLVAAYESESEFMRLSHNKPLVDLIDAALSAPPRNCDVGSPEEQAQRMEKFCKSHGHGFDGQKCYSCENCKLISVDRCELAWAQMPYETEQKGKTNGSK